MIMTTGNPTKDIDKLGPLFAPHEEPRAHRAKGEKKNSPSRVVPHRRPSALALAQNLRELVGKWREEFYPGASETTRQLLAHWFGRAHRVLLASGGEVEFRYYFCQREAIETIIYLKEVRRIDTLSQLWADCGGERERALAEGIDPAEDAWTRYACKLATGAGKTKVMSLAVVWSYFHALREADSPMARHFVIVAPNIIVFERLREDFRPEGGGPDIFDRDPLIPSEWRGDWNLSVVLQDEAGGADTGGTLYLTNIHRLYDKTARKRRSALDEQPWAGPAVNTATALDTGAALRERILRHKRVLLLNDEAHHTWDTDSAWHEAIEFFHYELSARGGALVGQLDFTATPKDSKGQAFKHIICDTPLGEAVDAGIVKTPILGTVPGGLKNSPAEDAGLIYDQHLRLGYERWKKSFTEWKDSGKKPLLFVMCESTEAADQITRRLQTDPVFADLNNATLNLHTNLKGKIKKGVFVPDESKNGISDEDLKALRKLSRELDLPGNPYRCIVSVLMLREGWDVRNVTTIVPLRKLTAANKILVEQMLGRGLRRMTPPVGGVKEIVTVVDHPIVAGLYDQQLAQEGVEIGVTSLDKVPRTTVSIFPDEERKDIVALDIPIPQISAGAINTSALGDIDFKEIKAAFVKLQIKPLALGKPSGDADLEYEGRLLVTGEILEKMRLQLPLLRSGITAVSYFVKELELIARLRGTHGKLAPLVQRFLTELLFGRNVPLNDAALVSRLGDSDVREYMRAVFAPLLRKKTILAQTRAATAAPASPAAWKPYQATESENHPVKRAARTLFNLSPCNRQLEAAFVDFLERATDVSAFVKNAGPQCLRVDYLGGDSRLAFYTPDFLVRLADGHRFLVETKGREDRDVPRKARAAIEWCRSATAPGAPWSYLYITQGFFERTDAGGIRELAAAAEPTLARLIAEEDEETTMPLFAYGEKQAERASGAAGIVDGALLDALPARMRKAANEAIDLFRFHENKAGANYAPVFQPLLAPLDDAAKNYVYVRLKDKLPATRFEQEEWFLPSDSFRKANRGQLPRYDGMAKQLKRLMLYQNPTSPVGLLRNCFDYALNDTARLEGVFADVRAVLRFAGARDVAHRVGQTWELRNGCIAHGSDDDAKSKRLCGELAQRPSALSHLTGWLELLRILTGQTMRP